MSKIPTAEEIWKRTRLRDGGLQSALETTRIMKDFARFHVEAALKKASEDAKWKYSGNPEHIFHYSEDISIDKNSILNSYSLDNIE